MLIPAHSSPIIALCSSLKAKDVLTHSSEVRGLMGLIAIKRKNDFIYNDSDEILKLLISITKTLKDNK